MPLFRPAPWCPTRLLFTALLGLGLTLAAGRAPAQTAQPSEIDALVDRYLAAAEALDLETMASLWTEDVVYADPTAGARLEGRDNVKAALEKGMVGVRRMRLAVRSRFAANDHAVITYQGTADMALGGDAVAAVTADCVMILRIRDGLVAEHLDYIDYGAVQRQLAEAGP